jgi:hypothetical protein
VASGLTYWVALLLVVIPLLTLAPAWPPRVATAGWRFGVFGILASTLLLPTVGVVLASYTATALGHRRTLATIALASGTAAVLLLVGLAGFALDTLQVLREVPPARATAFWITVGRAVLQTVACAGTGIVVAAGGIREVRRRGRAHAPHRAPPMIVGAAKAVGEPH